MFNFSLPSLHIISFNVNEMEDMIPIASLVCEQWTSCCEIYRFLPVKGFLSLQLTFKN